ncbi:hypothetical protein ACH5RR_041006 [Cinchona calisaya]|uniref:Uncharacterized protein n=1 Tax=Cinchona calisaya TaxID=153742 RepID=A0ABD2XXR1_9GENT
MDVASATISRSNHAKICVELDLKSPLRLRVWLGIREKGKWQAVTYDEEEDVASTIKLNGKNVESNRVDKGSKTSKLSRRSYGGGGPHEEAAMYKEAVSGNPKIQETTNPEVLEGTLTDNLEVREHVLTTILVAVETSKEPSSKEQLLVQISNEDRKLIM